MDLPQIAVWTNVSHRAPRFSGRAEIDAVADADLLINLHLNHYSGATLPAVGSDRHRSRSLADLGGRRRMLIPPHTLPRQAKPWDGLVQFPDLGKWDSSSPVCLQWWPVVQATPPLLTTFHWAQGLAKGRRPLLQRERTGFQPFLDLPRHTCKPWAGVVVARGRGRSGTGYAGRRGWRVRVKVVSPLLGLSLHSGLSWRVQLREALVRALRYLDQRPDPFT